MLAPVVSQITWLTNARACASIADVVGALGELDFAGVFIHVNEALRLEVEAAASHMHPAVGALEGRAVVGDAAIALAPLVSVSPDVARRRF